MTTGPAVRHGQRVKRIKALRVALVLVLAMLGFAPLAASSLVPRAAAATSTPSGPVSKSKTIDRVYVGQDGSKTTVDSRTVSVTVSSTTNLKSLQQLSVNWSGAHVTDGEELDLNSDLAQNEEYSFDLFECRGVDSTSVPAAEQLSPETCWTQFPDERFQTTPPDVAAWQSDYYATSADRADIVGAPNPEPDTCSSILEGFDIQRWVPFIQADGTVDGGGPRGCDGLAPEAAPENVSSLSLPSNETYGVTGADGSGAAQFDVFTDEDHASLGCSATVKCSLVAVPIEGISCDPYGTALPAADQPDPDTAAQAKDDCETTGNFKPGELLNNVETTGATAVDGALWWSASNWRNRISFPLSFAQSDNICSLTSTAPQVQLYGAESFAQAATQWSPHFCLNPKLFNPALVQSAEPEARSLLAENEDGTKLSDSGVEAAVGSYPPTVPYPKPTVQAPVAVSGWGIAFEVDNATTHQQVLSLNLDARLLAKLLTESYPAVPVISQTYPTNHGLPTLSNNPLNITDDPEFQLLNPGVSTSTSLAAAALLTVNVQADVMTALTTYINDDPAARAWLNGEPDPWGMQVNPNYRNIQLPVSRWPLLDSYEPTDYYNGGNNPCLQADPVPYLPLIQNPQASFYQIALDSEFAIAQPETTCSLPSNYTQGQTAGLKLVASGREAPGYRFMLSVISLPDAARYSLHLASLETYPSMSSTDPITGTTGYTFVSPTAKALKAAAALATPNTTNNDYEIPTDSLRSATNQGAYPGTLLINAAVPTAGLAKSAAASYAKYLTYAGGPGQVQGASPGDLPAGYLPITAKNGLGALASYTQRAATEVADQSGKLPSFTAPVKTAKPKPSPTATSTKTPTTTPTTMSSPPPVPAVSTPPGTTPAATSPKVASNSTSPLSLGKAALITAGFGKLMLPIVLVVLLIAGGAAVALQLLKGRR